MVAPIIALGAIVFLLILIELDLSNMHSALDKIAGNLSRNGDSLRVITRKIGKEDINDIQKWN